MGRITVRRRITRITVGSAPRRREDVLAAEEPLEIRVGGQSLAITMRTPGNDFDLAVGFLVSEGIVSRGEQVSSVRYCAGARPGSPTNEYNVLDVTLAPGVPAPDPSLERSFYTTSSCGLCGKASIDAVRTTSAYTVAADPMRISARTLTTFPEILRSRQAVFEKTGGLHAAALFDATTSQMLMLCEDVGRHNAVDKVIGWAAANHRLPLTGTVLMVSGRASFELTQKALMAGIPLLAAVSAPSSLAVELADEAGITLVGFLRGDSMVVYSGAERIVEEETTDEAVGGTLAASQEEALGITPDAAPKTSSAHPLNTPEKVSAS
ncbi:formate dehydrogenase accessory sulfurtransferase FdhD [Lysinibacter sp. HNR]|uniref:formate dehydrogenase accessory sulfurtransferase FdhD n=1 Tax=Lysinibacter sp. HNR TaxID=3031408 RepID=UPI002434E1D9|nr:formate dehydrogenase accessory sulfurtransferase FdhD [Lysinibacter sp. HNR]WGD36564.1 formate dehydrogenase accessory sulfurtransferase FdhD [Lysinibacter sp. HNR]